MIHALTSALNVHLRISYLGDVSFATSPGSSPTRAPAQAARDAKGKGKAREAIHDEGFVEFNYQAAIKYGNGRRIAASGIIMSVSTRHTTGS